MQPEIFKKLEERYPFLSICRYADKEYVGIICNTDNNITSLYDFGHINTKLDKELFLELAEVWWWESNRSLPINLFLKSDWQIFKPTLRTFINKNLEILAGPITSLNDITHTKRKRKSIVLVQKVNE